MAYVFPGCLCGCDAMTVVHVYDRPPQGENVFPALTGRYRRELRRCAACGHFVSVFDGDLAGLYAAGYVDGVYRDAQGLRRNFERVNALPPERSDNAGRVAAVAEEAARHFPAAAVAAGLDCLDVGSGLCVFLHRLKAHGFRGVALDPDPRAARHAETVAGVPGVAADFMTCPPFGPFDLLAFNKVLEHVVDPAAMLARSRLFLRPGGLVHVELPDGEAAFAHSPGREEFFIEHHHVFSAASVCHLAKRAGMFVNALRRLREPSGKFTFRAFLVPADAAGGKRSDHA
ncbi:MAG: class I SAM-dependent methyltransferase [Desulfovibrio sp.]